MVTFNDHRLAVRVLSEPIQTKLHGQQFLLNLDIPLLCVGESNGRVGDWVNVQ